MIDPADPVLVIVIPGVPVAQGRPEFSTFGGNVRAVDPKKSRTWKRYALDFYRDAVEAAGGVAPFFADGPLDLRVEAVWECPKGDIRKRCVPGWRPMDRHRGDGSNVLKAVEDAANLVLWRDDCQIARLQVDRWIAPPGVMPYVRVMVRRWRAAEQLEEPATEAPVQASLL